MKATFVAVALRAALLVGTCALPLGCASASSSAAGGEATRPLPRAETVEVVRGSPVARLVREAPAVARSGIARLVTMVPLDPKRVDRLAPAVAKSLVSGRLEQETALALEATLPPDEIEQLAALLERDAVRSAVAAALVSEPRAGELERFVEDPASLPEERRARVRALVDVSWSPATLDRMTRAPVAVAGRVVAAALPDDDDARRAELLRIGNGSPPADIDALVVAFAFLWRELSDAELDEAREAFTSPTGARGTAALLDAAVAGLDVLAAEMERAVR